MVILSISHTSIYNSAMNASQWHCAIIAVNDLYGVIIVCRCTAVIWSCLLAVMMYHHLNIYTPTPIEDNSIGSLWSMILIRSLSFMSAAVTICRGGPFDNWLGLVKLQLTFLNKNVCQTCLPCENYEKSVCHYQNNKHLSDYQITKH